MFGKSKGNSDDGDQSPASVQQVQPLTVADSAAPKSTEAISSISSGVTIVGKVSGEGTVKVFGRIEGELHASTVLISDGGQVDGDVVADELTVAGRIKGTIHAGRVKLNGTAVVEGDIFHRSLTIEENARFEGSSRREENITSRVQANRPQPQAVSIDGKWNRNGAPGNEKQAKPAAE